MIDISPCYAEAIRNIVTWRNRYSAQEYPHKVVLNMMYRAYTMENVWGQYMSGNLPRFSSTDEALKWMEKYYAQVALEKVNSRLMYWLEEYPSKNVGTITFSNYERLATAAEKDNSKREELEFSWRIRFSPWQKAIA